MNSFVKELCDGNGYVKTAKKLGFEVEETILKEFVRYVKRRKSKPKFSGLSFEVSSFLLVKVLQPNCIPNFS